MSKKLITPTKSQKFANRTDSFRGKSSSCPITFIWPRQLGFGPLPERSLHWRRRRLWARPAPQRASKHQRTRIGTNSGPLVSFCVSFVVEPFCQYVYNLGAGALGVGT